MTNALALLASLIISLSVSSPVFSKQISDESKIEKILNKADTLYRSSSSQITFVMSIENENWERELEVEMWTKGMSNTLITIKRPKKDAGVSTLRKDKEMWNYFPKIDKVIKVPSSMMMGSWMGSDFTNDDLVKENTFLNDYHASFTNKEDKTNYHIELIPKEDTVSVWGKVKLVIDRKTLILISQTGFNERGKKARTISFTNVKNMGGKSIPTVMEIVSHKKTGDSKTTIRYKKAKFNLPLKNSIFSRRNLQKRR
jgi:hypothetical protein